MRPIFVFIKCEMGRAYRVAQEAADSIEELSELKDTLTLITFNAFVGGRS